MNIKSCSKLIKRLKLSRVQSFLFSEIKFINRTFSMEKFKSLQLRDSSSSSALLKEKIKTKIHQSGPISISEYMSMCLYDSEYGYYTTKDKIFGEKGDFITAPECSQLFGEMIAIFLYKVIESFHFPQTLDLIEIGGGTGHLMADILNTFYDFNLLKCLNIKMIEKSEKLQKVQQETVFERLAKRNIYMQYIFDENSKLELFKSTNDDIPLTIQWLDDIEVMAKTNESKIIESFKAKFESVKSQMIGITQGKINSENFNDFIKTKQFQDSLGKTNQKYKCF